MLRLTSFACAMFWISSAHAADLARHSPLGEVFAERPTRVVIRGRAEPGPEHDVFSGIALKVPGYYGRATDFQYRSYYGTSPVAIYSRLPYACGLVGLC